MLKRTPLYERHLAWGARMVEFGGWEMPVQYGGLMEEHRVVRTSAGLFDISHMGRFMITGHDAQGFLQYVVTCDVASIGVGQSSYGLMCHPHGGVVDDIFIYRLPTEYLLVVNAANRQKDWDWLQQHTPGFDVSMEDVSEKWAMLALQGPAAEKLFCQARDMASSGIDALPFHEIAMFNFFGIGGMIGRTGYTGEDGFEIFFDASHAAHIWESLLKLGDGGSVKPCGLGARDSLRFEPCLALYGHEIADDINPYEARLGWVVKLGKGNFVGREALVGIKQAGVQRKLTGFEMVGRGVARSGYPIHSTEGQDIGFVTTGMPSPTLGKPLGMGYVPTALSSEGSEFDILIRNKPVRARAVKMPFYKPRYKK
jgi:aminomethyltransferase